MADNETDAVEELPLEGVGQRLRRAREDKKLSLKEIAAETRIPMRHLETIETGDFSQLPARTYAIGFARSYARVVGMDEREVADQVRGELSGHVDSDPTQRSAKFEPGDPARIPSRRLAWFSAFAALLLVAGGLSYFKGYFFPGAGPGPLAGPEEQAGAQAATAQAPAQQAPPSGAVVFTALEDDTWVKFYDASGSQLMQKQMAKGERYTVPADAEGPQVWTGRPFALAITIGGQSVPKLSEADEIIKDVPVTAEALLARTSEPATGSPPAASADAQQAPTT